MTPSPRRSAASADRMTIAGRRVADRRIRVKRQTSPYFRYAGPGTVTARPAASAPRHWWERFLYNENGQRIQRALLGHANILVAEVPYRRSV